VKKTCNDRAVAKDDAKVISQDRDHWRYFVNRMNDV